MSMAQYTLPTHWIHIGMVSCKKLERVNLLTVLHLAHACRLIITFSLGLTLSQRISNRLSALHSHRSSSWRAVFSCVIFVLFHMFSSQSVFISFTLLTLSCISSSFLIATFAAAYCHLGMYQIVYVLHVVSSFNDCV